MGAAWPILQVKQAVLSLDLQFMEAERRDLPSLLGEARAGDGDAFGEVCRTYETRLLRQAMSLCGNLDLAEDLAQETLVEAWRSLHRYNGRSQFFTWLCAILLNRFRNNLRQKRPWLRGLAAKVDELFQIEEQIIDPQSLPDEMIELREQALLVQKCIQVLSQKHQQVIFLRFYVDDSIESIAAALGCSKGTVKSRLFHALEKLRAMKILKGANQNPYNFIRKP